MTNTTPTQGTRRTLRLTLIAALLAGTALSGFAVANITHAATGDSAVAIQPKAPSTRIPDFADLVSTVKPAVVSITTKMTVTDNDETKAGPGAMQIPFGAKPQRPRSAEARGSGFIIDANGIVVTNNHVVEGATSVSITLDDGTVLPAKIIGRDLRTDLAVLKVEAGKPLAFIKLGDSDQVRPGEWVVAMGNPFGLGGSVSAGIVSASGRDIGAGPYDNFIQIDAPINRGNSGGPLFTQGGEVVGVNTAIFSPTGGSIGIGFAIPSNTVKSVVAQLQNGGRVTRGYLGVEAQPITPEMAQALHLVRTDGAWDKAGALVANVAPDSPADKSGVQPGDVIRAVNGKPVHGARDLAIIVAGVQPGEQARIELLRDGEAKNLTVAVGTLRDAAEKGAKPAGEDAAQGQEKLGVGLAAITPDMRRQLDLPERTRGAVVAQVQPGSIAEQAGIQPGDVILGVGPRAVTSPEDAVEAIRSALGGKGGKALALRIWRDGHAAYVPLKISPENERNQG